MPGLFLFAEKYKKGLTSFFFLLEFSHAQPAYGDIYAKTKLFVRCFRRKSIYVN